MAFEVIYYEVELYKDGCWHTQDYGAPFFSYEESECRCRFLYRATKWPSRVVCRHLFCGRLLESTCLEITSDDLETGFKWLREGF